MNSNDNRLEHGTADSLYRYCERCKGLFQVQAMFETRCPKCRGETVRAEGLFDPAPSTTSPHTEDVERLFWGISAPAADAATKGEPVVFLVPPAPAPQVPVFAGPNKDARQRAEWMQQAINESILIEYAYELEGKKEARG